MSRLNTDDEVQELCFTGHSLGGALANLAAYEFSSMVSSDIAVRCYTFGAPKVGNLYFTADYNGRLPNTFRVVNDRDPIPELPATGGPTKYRHVKNLVYRTAAR